MNKDNKNELIVIKKQSIFSKIANFIKNIFGKKENLVDEVISQENIEKIELEKVSDLEEKVIDIKRVTKVVKGGRQFRFSATVVVGNRKGKVGIGIGKAKEMPDAVIKLQKL